MKHKKKCDGTYNDDVLIVYSMSRNLHSVSRIFYSSYKNIYFRESIQMIWPHWTWVLIKISLCIRWVIIYMYFVSVWPDHYQMTRWFESVSLSDHIFLLVVLSCVSPGIFRSFLIFVRWTFLSYLYFIFIWSSPTWLKKDQIINCGL